MSKVKAKNNTISSLRDFDRRFLPRMRNSSSVQNDISNIDGTELAKEFIEDFERRYKELQKQPKKKNRK